MAINQNGSTILPLIDGGSDVRDLQHLRVDRASTDISFRAALLSSRLNFPVTRLFTLLLFLSLAAVIRLHPPFPLDASLDVVTLPLAIWEIQGVAVQCTTVRSSVAAARCC